MSKRRRDQSSAAPDAGVVRLNVGGTIYTTTLDTLRSVPDSLFGRMFDPDISLGMVPTDEDGNTFFDRDPEVFRFGGSIPIVIHGIATDTDSDRQGELDSILYRSHIPEGLDHRGSVVEEHVRDLW